MLIKSLIFNIIEKYVWFKAICSGNLTVKASQCLFVKDYYSGLHYYMFIYLYKPKKQHVPIPIQIYSTKHQETDLTGNVDFILQLQDKTRHERKNKVREQR